MLLYLLLRSLPGKSSVKGDLLEAKEALRTPLLRTSLSRLSCFSRARSTRESTIRVCACAATASFMRRYHSTDSRKSCVVRADPSSWTWAAVLPASGSEPAAQRKRSEVGRPYFRCRSCVAVSWRRVAAEESSVMELLTSRRTVEVSRSISSRCASVRWAGMSCLSAVDFVCAAVAVRRGPGAEER